VFAVNPVEVIVDAVPPVALVETTGVVENAVRLPLVPVSNVVGVRVI
jgi:hypothetical protein